MNEYSIRLAKPHCEACHQPKEKRAENRVDVVPNVEVVMDIPLAKTGTDSPIDLKSRLTRALHGGIQGKPDDEGDI